MDISPINHFDSSLSVKIKILIAIFKLNFAVSRCFLTQIYKICRFDLICAKIQR